jgi:uncharacterized protein YbjQ (UPF0145 family)
VSRGIPSASEVAALPADLPLHARERLVEMRTKKLFTSDLSVSEFLLVKQAGFDPMGLVMGTSIYQVSPSFPPIPKGQPGLELVDMTRALYHARELAMNRMEEEAEALGADGIVGVRLEVNLNTDPQRALWKQYRQWQSWARSVGMPRQLTPAMMVNWQQIAWTQWVQWCQRMAWSPQPPPWSRLPQRASYTLGQNVAEFIAIGTAVRSNARASASGESFKNVRGRPFQSDLNGQDFWTLVRAGYRPVGFVMGNCVYYVPPALLRAPDARSVELSAYTHALYDARELAIERLQHEAEALGATGIVGVTVAEKQHSWRTNNWNVGNAALQTGELIELFVIGTAVVPMKTKGTLPKPRLVLSANDIAKPAQAESGGEE